jgi:hypothetical protein
MSMEERRNLMAKRKESFNLLLVSNQLEVLLIMLTFFLNILSERKNNELKK